MASIPYKKIKSIVKKAIQEDIGRGDITTKLIVCPQNKIEAIIICKEKSVLCGIELAREAFYQINPNLKFHPYKKDGQTIKKNEIIAEIKGEAASILTAERVALNFICLLSGIATYTQKFVSKIKGTKAKIMDTRKTTPGLRILEKYAVRVGGGYNHRYGLWDGILVKDNHLRVCQVISKNKIKKRNLSLMMKKLKKSKLPVEIEAENFYEFCQIIKFSPDIIMLDNFSLSEIKKAVNYRNKYFPKVKLEASGGITLTNIKDIALTGIDFISIGSLTHSPEAIDFSLEIKE